VSLVLESKFVQVFNPRQHFWRFNITISIIFGLVLATSQNILEGGASVPLRTALIVPMIFFVGEGLATFIGVAIFNYYLGLFRRD
jgi:hypothetical protein